jgi:hypothetical protein
MERITELAKRIAIIIVSFVVVACVAQLQNAANAPATFDAPAPSTSATIAAPLPSASTSAPAAQPPCVDSGKGLFNDCAVLDTSRIDDLRSVADKGDELFVAEDGHLIAADAE